MANINITKGGGQLPAWDARFIPDDQASFCRDTFLYSGAIVGWRKPKLLRALTNSAAKYAYRVPTSTQGTANVTLTVTAPVANDTVTLGEITYKFVVTPTNPFDVLLGGTPTQSAQALFQAVNFGSYDKTVVGDKTPANPAIASASPVIGFPYALAGATNTPGANTIALVPIIPQSTMNISAVSLMPAATQGAAKFKGVVYDSVNQINATGTAFVDIPSSLVITGAEVVGCTSGVPVVSNLAIPVTLQGGRTYFLGFIMDTAIPLTRASSGTLGVSNKNTYSSGPPNPFQTTSLSGITVGGTNVGSLQTGYNLSQPNWMIWGNVGVLSPTNSINTLVGNVLHLQAPAFGTSFNQTPVAESTAGVRLSWSGATFFTGGVNQVADTLITGVSKWLEFLDQDTNVLRTPVVNDVFQRYYFASPTLPPQYNTYDRITAGLPPWYLGVPAPPIAPTLSTGGGGSPTQIGFPGSVTPNVVTLDAGTGMFMVLYPMQSSVGVTLNDISFVLPNEIGGIITIQAHGIVFADGGNVSGGTAGVPSDLIGECDIAVQSSGTTYISPALTGINLNPNTQYWIGVIVQANSDVFALSDLGTKGYSASLPLSGGLPKLPINPVSGLPTAPVMTANYPDLQLWADLSPGATGGAQEETRAYVYTWVTAYGEEGPPSPPALLDAFDNATWTVGLQPPLAEDMGVLRNIVKTNIYRTMASVQGGTVFFFVGSVAATATTFIDQVTDDVVALNLILPSTTWFGPPATLQGIVSMPNGMMAGFRNNEVWFCEPYRPHAWPAGYVMTTDYPIVGLGVTGITLVACTETNPSVFTGVNPSVMSQTKVALPEPCISRGSILSTELGVYYASANGLIHVAGTGVAGNLTQNWITREKWDALTPQKFVRATKNVSSYFAFGTTGVTNGQADVSVAQRGFTLELSEVADKESFTLWPQVGGHRLGFSSLSSPLGLNIDNVEYDPWSGVAFLIAGGSIYYYDFTDPVPQITPYIWRSKKFQGPHKDNFAAFRVWFDVPPGGPQSPPALRTTIPFTNSPPMVAGLTYQPGMFGVVRIIADGTYVTERELRFSTELMRVASAQKYTTWQIEVEGIVSVTNIKMATTVKELGTMGKK